jgi:transposase
VHASEQERADVQQARQAWSKAQPGMDLEKLVFIDETWTSTSMTRRYGRAPRGQRCIGSAPHGHWKTTTFVAGLRQRQLTAPLVADGPMDGELFLAYVRQFLCPTLRPGDIVILDNLSSHKVAGVKQAIAAAGATLLYLPPYSPDLNPIEKLFAKLKALLRKAAKRSVDALWNEIGDLLNTISAAECANYFTSSGYVYT